MQLFRGTCCLYCLVPVVYVFTIYFGRHTSMYRVFRAQADRTLTHTSHKDTEQSTIEASITLDGVTLIR
jgi:hypothetical protein